MYLNSNQVPFYLQSRNLVNSHQMINGECIVIAKAHRNRNFKVFDKSGKGYFLKQVTATDPYALSFLKREASCYLLVRDETLFESLRTIMPQLIDYDPERYIITQTLLANADNLSDCVRKTNTFEPQIGGEIGRKLAICHSEEGWSLANFNNINVFPKSVPWVLNFYEEGKNPFPNMTPNISAIHTTITSDPMIISVLKHLAQNWTYSSLIHGDIKWDNIVVSQENDNLEIKFVDWELVDVGDPAWDVAGFIQNYLIAIILSTPEMIDEQSSLLAYPNKIEHNQFSQQVYHFYQAYFKANKQIQEADKQAFIYKTVQYAGARLLQSAFEFSPNGQQLPKLILPLIELSKYLLLKPEENAKSIFGV